MNLVNASFWITLTLLACGSFAQLVVIRSLLRQVARLNAKVFPPMTPAQLFAFEDRMAKTIRDAWGKS